MLWVVVIAFAASYVQNAAGVCNYCVAPNGPSHTMCKPIQTPACGTSYSLTASDKTKILDLHNKIRKKLVDGTETMSNNPLPKACKMCDLIWLDEAATIAKRHTERCEFKHDTDRNLCNGTYCGQNVAISSSYPKSATPSIDIILGLINLWYEEVKDFRSSDICSFVSKSYGHYTQMIWAKTCYIGCSLTIYADKDNAGWYNYLLACNYCLGGNFLNQPVYQIPCSDTTHRCSSTDCC